MAAALLKTKGEPLRGVDWRWRRCSFGVTRCEEKFAALCLPRDADVRYPQDVDFKHLKEDCDSEASSFFVVEVVLEKVLQVQNWSKVEYLGGSVEQCLTHNYVFISVWSLKNEPVRLLINHLCVHIQAPLGQFPSCSPHSHHTCINLLATLFFLEGVSRGGVAISNPTTRCH